MHGFFDSGVTLDNMQNVYSVCTNVVNMWVLKIGLTNVHSDMHTHSFLPAGQAWY